MTYCKEFSALLDPYIDGELSPEETAGCGSICIPVTAAGPMSRPRWPYGTRFPRQRIPLCRMASPQA